jgi:putative addiction module component (TIGR02574 family)
MAPPEIDISLLSREERLRPLEELWDSFESNPEDLPLTEPQRSELRGRVAAMDRTGNKGIPWEEVLRQIQARKQK